MTMSKFDAALDVCRLSNHLHLQNTTNRTNIRWEQAQEMLIADPSVSKTLGSSYGALPILVAVMNNPPLTLVQSLIAANPGALMFIHGTDRSCSRGNLYCMLIMFATIPPLTLC